MTPVNLALYFSVFCFSLLCVLYWDCNTEASLYCFVYADAQKTSVHSILLLKLLSISRFICVGFFWCVCVIFVLFFVCVCDSHLTI